MSGRRGPILIEEEIEGVHASPADAPPVPDTAMDAPTGQAMKTMAALASRRSSALGRWFRRVAVALLGFAISVAAWSWLESLIRRNEILGLAALILVAAFLILLFALCVREVAALWRLQKVGQLHLDAEAAMASPDMVPARAVADRLVALYAGRAALDWQRARFEERRGEVLDPDALFRLAERELLAPLDAAARVEIEAAARQVATVTAVVPLALADVATALASNLRMIRRIAEIYGGRAGTVGAWRLTKAVMTHLVATGAVAVGDDLIGSVAGGSVLTRVSRRFGEGIVNGALTARVGIAAMEVCRPLPFAGEPRPQVHRLIGRALSGLFPGSEGRDG
ncbi:putative membrane protein [Palleronia aestuarii]|uniref:Putative membrane protein n=1 Tax=Palleronia aestuarii TaxID=568105 RepID=A0A2W7P6P2_9RHOB|nr:TIGR01620 family protein [Palleronia aestuarii]PZX19062.1 putative membrane protein [Palleronia aestuarii]